MLTSLNSAVSRLAHGKTLSGRVQFMAVAALLLMYGFMCLSPSGQKCCAFDEISHLAVGYNMWLNGDFRCDPCNGDFVKRWAALPLVLTAPAFPSIQDPAWRMAETFVLGFEFLYQKGNDAQSLLLQGRFMVMLLGVLLGLLVYLASRELFGVAGGLVSLVLYCFCPNMLAHGGMVTTDLAFSLMFFGATWSIWRLMHKATWWRLSFSLLFFGLLLVSKLTAVLIFPVAAVMLLFRLWSGGALPWHLGRYRLLGRRPAVAGALALLVLVHAVWGWASIWACYNFKYLARADVGDATLTFQQVPGGRLPEVEGMAGGMIRFCKELQLLPEGYLTGAQGQLVIEKRQAFLNGQWKIGGWHGFFPYAFLVKTPLPFFLVFGFGLAGWWFHWSHNKPGKKEKAAIAQSPLFYGTIPFVVLIVVYGGIMVSRDLNIGHRHILPVYPAFYVLAGSCAVCLAAAHRWSRVALWLVPACLFWFVSESLLAQPHYLAYFSQLAGGSSRGYKHMVDSSLDWGQDLPGLKQWLDENNDRGREPVYFSYFGTGSPEYYGIKSKRLPGFFEWRPRELYPLSPGIYAVSATLAESVYTGTPGPWNRMYEQQYQQVLSEVKTMEDPATREQYLKEHPQEFIQQLYDVYEKLRFGRLSVWLRQHPPDANIGGSILIWRLGAGELGEALYQKPAELYQAPFSEF